MKLKDSEKREQIRKIILPVAIESFYKYGIRAVKMDDIASSLKMSKRTLYEVYDNKMQLLCDVVEYSIMRKHKLMHEYSIEHDNVMDLLTYFFRIQMEDYEKISPVFFADFRRYPELVSKVQSIHEKNDRSIVFFQRGVEQGYFRKDVNYAFLAHIGADFGEMFRVDKRYAEYSFSDIFSSFICTLLRGICTDEGFKLFNGAISNLEK